VENLSHTGIRFPDCPTRSESLYILRYPGPQLRKISLWHLIFIAFVWECKVWYVDRISPCVQMLYVSQQLQNISTGWKF